MQECVRVYLCVCREGGLEGGGQGIKCLNSLSRLTFKLQDNLQLLTLSFNIRNMCVYKKRRKLEKTEAKALTGIHSV